LNRFLSEVFFLQSFLSVTIKSENLVLENHPWLQPNGQRSARRAAKTVNREFGTESGGRKDFIEKFRGNRAGVLLNHYRRREKNSGRRKGAGVIETILVNQPGLSCHVLSTDSTKFMVWIARWSKSPLAVVFHIICNGKQPVSKLDLVMCASTCEVLRNPTNFSLTWFGVHSFALISRFFSFGNQKKKE